MSCICGYPPLCLFSSPILHFASRLPVSPTCLAHLSRSPLLQLSQQSTFSKRSILLLPPLEYICIATLACTSPKEDTIVLPSSQTLKEPWVASRVGIRAQQFKTPLSRPAIHIFPNMPALSTVSISQYTMETASWQPRSACFDFDSSSYTEIQSFHLLWVPVREDAYIHGFEWPSSSQSHARIRQHLRQSRRMS